ncbi:MAG: ATP-binding protein, partial [Deltaproteobacteria bacterium]|nr:ATP-binding protein [Deltaproteobacteria bacterium]
LAPLAARWRIGPGTISRVITHVTDGGAPVNLSSTVIDRAVSQHLERRLGDVAERQKWLPALADMVLPSDIMDSLTEFLARMRLHRRVFDEWGMTRIATTGRGITALFQGPPGTGKTMVAGALARELGIELYRVDLSRVMSKWIGETEKNLANVFSAAEEGQAIILFDEADSLFSKRSEVKSASDKFANLEVNYLLQRLDSFIGVAILTTNMGAAIDSAFKRRLQFRIHFPIPDEEQREQLWRAHVPPTLPVTDDLDFADLAKRYPLTGGSVRNCVMRAAFLAAAEDKPLGQDYLVRAIRLEYRAAGKLSETGPLE